MLDLASTSSRPTTDHKASSREEGAEIPDRAGDDHHPMTRSRVLEGSSEIQSLGQRLDHLDRLVLAQGHGLGGERTLDHDLFSGITPNLEDPPSFRVVFGPKRSKGRLGFHDLSIIEVHSYAILRDQNFSSLVSATPPTDRVPISYLFVLWDGDPFLDGRTDIHQTLFFHGPTRLAGCTPFSKNVFVEASFW